MFASEEAAMEACVASGLSANSPTLASTSSLVLLSTSCVCSSLDLGPGRESTTSKLRGCGKPGGGKTALGTKLGASGFHEKLMLAAGLRNGRVVDVLVKTVAQTSKRKIKLNIRLRKGNRDSLLAGLRPEIGICGPGGTRQKQAELHCSPLHSTPNPSDGSAADRSSGMKRRGQAVCCNRGKRCDVQKRLTDTVECTSRRYGATSS